MRRSTPASTSSTTPGSTTRARAKSAWAAPSTDRRDRVFLMTKVCTHGRDAQGRDAPARAVAAAPADRLPRPLADPRVRLRQRPGAPLRRPAASSRRSSGRSSRARCATSASPGTRIRRSTCEMLSFGYPFDACQLPLNGFDASFRSFQQHVLPGAGAARDRGHRHEEPGRRRPRGEASARHGIEDALRYAMSLPVCTTVSRHRLAERAAPEPRRSPAASRR